MNNLILWSFTLYDLF